MGKHNKRSLYAKLNSFKWREGWQNIIVFFGLFLFMLLGMLLARLFVLFWLGPN